MAGNREEEAGKEHAKCNDDSTRESLAYSAICKSIFAFTAWNR
jgi:hypothetical protein